MDRAAHFGWSLEAIERLRPRVGALVIVDVLSFSTAVDVAVARGAEVIPMAQADPDVVRARAEQMGAVAAGRRNSGGLSLSPASLRAIEPGVRLVLPSPNGARLSVSGGDTPVLAGCLRNAGAVAQAAKRIAGERDVGVIAAGEHWPDGDWRFAIEDYLGAGAVLDALGLALEGETPRARDAFRAAGQHVGDLVRGSISGRELIGRGFEDDVALAVEREVSQAAPRLVEGAYRVEPQKAS